MIFFILYKNIQSKHANKALQSLLFTDNISLVYTSNIFMLLYKIMKTELS